jgi:dTDP-glucose 4,6-dehydratase
VVTDRPTLGGVSSVTSQHGESLPGESARPAAVPSARAASWGPWLIAGCYLLAASALTWRLWVDPAGRIVAGDPGDVNLFAWYMRYSATAVSHGRLPALITAGLNAPQGINLMWNTSILLPGVLLAPVTLLAGPQTSLTILLTAGFAGSAISLFVVLRRWGASLTAAALGGAVYGFSPALITAGTGHFQLQFAVLPPLIIDAVLRIVTGRGRAVRTGVWLGLLTAAQLFIGEELLVDTAVAAAVMVVVLVLGHPRAALEAVRERVPAIAAGLGTAAVVAVLTCGYALWAQFRGPLASHGSPWQVARFHSYPSVLVTPSGALVFHTTSSAAAAAAFPEPSPEYLAYLGWPLLIAAVVAAVCFWRDPKVRLTAVTWAVLELFCFGAIGGTLAGIRYPGSVLPWHWLARLPVLADVLPDRFAILADGAAAALLAFALDRARRLAPRGQNHRLIGLAAIAAAVLVALPLVPRPLPAAAVSPAPAGWQAAFARLRLASGAHVLVIPDVQYDMRWQAETGVPGSMVGGGDFIEPDATGHATSYIYHRLITVRYLTALWDGFPARHRPSQAQIREDLAYWQLAAIVTVTSRDSRLYSFLTGEFGPPAVQVDNVMAWRLPSQASQGKLSPRRRKGRAGLMTETIVITGGAGFLGSHLSERLLADGCSVICLDNFCTGAPGNVAHLIENPAFRLVRYDVTEYLYVGGPVDTVLHFASPASPVDYLELPIETLKVGSMGTIHALGLAREKGARFLLASTSEVYGDPLVHPQGEDYWGNVNPVGPRGVYDEAKRFSEALTVAYRKNHAVRTKIVRIFNTYGPRMRPNDGRAIPTFIRQALREEPITVSGDGSQTRSVCYVSDLVEGILRLLRSSHPGPMNLGNPSELSVLELAETIRQLTGSQSPITFIPRPQDDPMVRQPRIDLAREVLGWKPEVGLEEGLERTIGWFRERAG